MVVQVSLLDMVIRLSDICTYIYIYIYIYVIIIYIYIYIYFDTYIYMCFFLVAPKNTFLVKIVAFTVFHAHIGL